MTDDYLGAPRERFGDDAATREPEPDDLDDDDDPDYDLDLCGPDGAGEWYGTRPVEVVEIPGVSR